MAEKEPLLTLDGQASPGSNCHHTLVVGGTSATNSQQVDPDSSENPHRSVHDGNSMSNINGPAPQTGMAEPQTVHDDTFHDNNALYSSSYTSSYPSSYTPYPHDFSQIPSSSITPQETIRQRTQRLWLQRGDILDPFREWVNLVSGTYGDIIPSEFYLSSAPFALHSLRGQARLRFLCNAFCMPPDSAGICHIQAFLSRNPVIIKFLSFSIVPDPKLLFDEGYGVNIEDYISRKHNSNLLRAIRELAWTDMVVNETVRLSATNEAAWCDLWKVKKLDILPNVYQKMLEQDPQPKDEDLDSLHKKVVTRLRENRPNSLLRTVVMSEDVVE